MKRVLAIGMVLTVLALGIWSGCEQAEGVDGLTVSPATATTGGSGSNSTTVVFTALVSSSLALPLEWSVSNPALGGIISQSGSNAVYKATKGAKGDNVVMVRDQYENEGMAVVTQQ